MNEYETYQHNGLTIRLWHDEDLNDPTDWGNYDIKMFNTGNYGHYNNGDKDDYFTENDKLLPSIQAKLKAGKLFPIYYRSYSGTDGGFYYLHDNAEEADGFIEFSDSYIKGISYEERKRYAEQDLKEYTSWANGEVYGWSVETPAGEILESVGGYIGYDSIEYMKQEAEAVADMVRASSLSKNARELHK